MMIDFGLQNKVNEEVYHASERMLSIALADIEKLIELAAKTGRQRVRLCAHQNANEVVQEMFIVHPGGAYVRPHKHINKPESFFILQGQAQYLLFSESGQIEQIVPMGDLQSGRTFYYTNRNDKYHSLIIESEWLVFLEITRGPFDRSDTDFPGWAPADIDLDAVDSFNIRINKELQEWQTTT